MEADDIIWDFREDYAAYSEVETLVANDNHNDCQPIDKNSEEISWILRIILILLSQMIYSG